MFEKLTPRERILATAVLCLVPITFLFIGLFSFINKSKAHDSEMRRLATAIGVEEDRERSAIKAENRRTYYNNISLSPQVEDAGNEYLDWLKTLLAETNLDYDTVLPRDVGELKAGKAVVGSKKRFSFSAVGELDELTDFLTRFYEVDTLHKISTLTINPKDEKSGNDKKVRTGKLGLSFVIEVASLTTADDNPDFASNLRDLPRPKEDYLKTILRRNIFGPANNVPSLSVRPSSKYDSGVKASINVSGKDADANDELTYELVESEIEGVTLKPSASGRSAKLSVPGQKEGAYKLRLKVTDDGSPPKENFANVTIRFKDKEIPQNTKREDVKKPYWPHAKQARISAITMSGGVWEVCVKVPTLGEKHRLHLGDSFKLDKKEWVLKSIAPHSAVMQVDGKLRTYNSGTMFDKPDSEEVMEPVKQETAPESGAVPAELESDEAPQPRNIVL